MTPSIHPGKAFLGELLARNWNLADTAQKTGLDPELLTDVFMEVEDVTPETAAGFEAATGVEAAYWLRLQAQHNATLDGNPLPTNMIPSGNTPDVATCQTSPA
ncbi:MAG: hypothetical protein JWM11_1619 [Planctomycetaceae bacterium]|nr:hypothetical protein [Planctomycetaceae bacterium]